MITDGEGDVEEPDQPQALWARVAAKVAHHLGADERDGVLGVQAVQQVVVHGVAGAHQLGVAGRHKPVPGHAVTGEPLPAAVGAAPIFPRVQQAEDAQVQDGTQLVLARLLVLAPDALARPPVAGARVPLGLAQVRLDEAGLAEDEIIDGEPKL